MCSLDVVKDNCVSAIVKLYLNPKYKNCCVGILNDQLILTAVISRLPIIGDIQESSYMLRAIFDKFRKNNSISDQILASKSTLKFFFDCLIEPQTHEIKPDVLTDLKEFLKHFQQNQAVQTVFNEFSGDQKNKIVTELKN